MKTIDEIIYDEYIDIPEYENEWFGQYLVVGEKLKMFEQKLSSELYKEYLNLCEEETKFECLRLRGLCKYAIERYKNLIN